MQIHSGDRVIYKGGCEKCMLIVGQFYVVDNIKSGQKIKLCGSMSWLDSSYFKVAWWTHLK